MCRDSPRGANLTHEDTHSCSEACQPGSCGLATQDCAALTFKQDILLNSLYMELLTVGKWDAIHHRVDIVRHFYRYIKAHCFSQVEEH